mmetsp:Transcript_60329/g.127765  ORF Transcript_60329/g.127765 Transcript_60329/m.127765 type:complete len:214 (-) Transcript_60329:14-655(-)
MASFGRLLKFYREWNAKRPLMVKAATTSTIFMASDTCAQLLNPPDLGHDVGRTAAFSFCGAVLTAPYFHNWFLIAERFLPGRSMWPVKLAVDALTVGPVYLLLLLTLQRSLRPLRTGESFSELQWDKVFVEAKQLWIDGLFICPVYQGINFVLIPPAYRVQWMGACQFFWNIYVAHVCGKATSNASHAAESQTAVKAGVAPAPAAAEVVAVAY